MIRLEIELYYYPEDHLFTDCDGFEVRDIYRYLDPSDLKIFWFYKRSMMFTNGIYRILLNYPTENEDLGDPYEYEIMS